MYPALVKHEIVRPSMFHITKLARASVSGRTQPSNRDSEGFFVNANFPDDFESSSLNSDSFQGQPPTMKSATTPEQFSAADIERHKTDIYESIMPKESKGSKMKKKPDPNLPEQEPSLDEM